MARIVDDLLANARSERAAGASEVVLGDELAEIQAEWGPRLLEAGRVLTTRCPRDTIVHATPGRLREAMRPEFLNRIDEIVLFRRLGRAQLREIVGLVLEASRARLASRDVSLEVTEAAVDWLAEHGYEPQYGANGTLTGYAGGIERKQTLLELEQDALF